ncbi:aldehyde dehydrogenase family protein [Virgifigura deserti]|uniref:aldehyde dehydrogenase family protein n=1 Tax=Virgifigura deserti TaxID=2268457 RepID=UPI003CCBB441
MRQKVPAPDEIFAAIQRAEAVQTAWAARPVAARLKILRRLRPALAADAAVLGYDLAALRSDWRAGDKMVAEVLPLLEACRFLERSAAGLLAARRLGSRGRPLWLFGTRAEVRREPLGVVLILAPSNYPLLLAGVQILQALVAGNAVFAKPAPNCAGPLLRLAELLDAAGLPDGLLTLLGENRSQAERAIATGRIAKVILTGSAETGGAVARALASGNRPIPAVMELSGSDAAFVLPGADLDLTAAALLYGLRLNGSATCIAPRRVFAASGAVSNLLERLRGKLADLPPAPLPAAKRVHLDSLLAEAERAGCHLHRATAGVDAGFRPVLVEGARTDLALLREDVFAPVLSFVAVDSVEEALRLDRHCPYALGASVFGPPRAAHALARRIEAGAVTVNDVIVPTADPRLPFGGRAASGFGVTRGPEGLLEMTAVKAITRRGRLLRPSHLDPPRDDDAEIYAALIAALHGDGAGRWRAWAELVRRLARRMR